MLLLEIQIVSVVVKQNVIDFLSMGTHKNPCFVLKSKSFFPCFEANCGSTLSKELLVLIYAFLGLSEALDT